LFVLYINRRIFLCISYECSLRWKSDIWVNPKKSGKQREWVQSQIFSCSCIQMKSIDLRNLFIQLQLLVDPLDIHSRGAHEHDLDVDGKVLNKKAEMETRQRIGTCNENARKEHRKSFKLELFDRSRGSESNCWKFNWKSGSQMIRYRRPNLVTNDAPYFPKEFRKSNHFYWHSYFASDFRVSHCYGANSGIFLRRNMPGIIPLLSMDLRDLKKDNCLQPRETHRII